jgi:hypothetical protein
MKPVRGSMGGARALSLATVDVVEGTGRELHCDRSEGELAAGWPNELDESERTRDQELRRRAAEKQQPD